MTQEFVDDMVERFKSGKTLHKKYVYKIVVAARQIVHDEATMVEMEIPDDVTLTVCGDTHGSSGKHEWEGGLKKRMADLDQASSSI